MTSANINAEVWEDSFVYDVTSPSFLRWSKDIINCFGAATKTKAGMVAGSLDGHGYYRVQYNRKCYKVHRIIYEMYHGLKIDVSDEVDHIDKDRANNIIDNLRATSINTRNLSMNSKNTSGVTGVSFAVVVQENGKLSPCWKASCVSLDGPRNNRSFCTNKYGDDLAFLLACECWAEMIRGLNSQGAGYTESHGVTL